MTSVDGGNSKDAFLTGARQDEIRARIQRTLDASRASAEPQSTAGAADHAARTIELEKRVVELTGELEAARQRWSQLSLERDQLAATVTALSNDKRDVEQKLATALRRLEGYAEEATVHRHKIEALELVLKRITGHRWYRAWDRLRMIMGKPSLHGPRKDPLGIKPVNPG